MPLVDDRERKRLCQAMNLLSEGKDANGMPIDFAKIASEVRDGTRKFAEDIHKGEEEGRRIFSGNRYVG